MFTAPIVVLFVNVTPVTVSDVVILRYGQLFVYAPVNVAIGIVVGFAVPPIVLFVPENV